MRARGPTTNQRRLIRPSYLPGGLASQMSGQRQATNISRALPGVRIVGSSRRRRRWSVRSESFFARFLPVGGAVASSARWAFVTAILLEAAWPNGGETSEGQTPPALVEDIARAVADGSMAKVETAAGATCEERETFVQLLRGECAGGR